MLSKQKGPYKVKITSCEGFVCSVLRAYKEGTLTEDKSTQKEWIDGNVGHWTAPEQGFNEKHVRSNFPNLIEKAKQWKSTGMSKSVNLLVACNSL
jgi:hypothetical protein